MTMSLAIPSHRLAANSGGRTPGSKLPASPPPLPRPNGGGNPGRVPVYTALKTQDPMPCRHNNKHVTTDKELHLCKTTLMVMTPYR